MGLGRRSGSVCCFADVWECCCQFTETAPRSQVFLLQWSWHVSFSELFLSCHFIREWPNALSLLPGQILCHDYDDIRSQGYVILEAVNPIWTFVSPLRAVTLTPTPQSGLHCVQSVLLSSKSPAFYCCTSA